MSNLNVIKYLAPVDKVIMNACLTMQLILNNDDIELDEAEEAIDKIKSSSQNKSVKIVSRIVSKVKRKGNYQNNNLENDLVKLGKEIHTSLNKLIKIQVKNPVIVGLLVEDTQAVAYKMTLDFDGLYQMVEISRFHFTRECVDDLVLSPAIVEKLAQVKEIVSYTITNLYDRLSKEEKSVDITSHTREACKTPISILAE